MLKHAEFKLLLFIGMVFFPSCRLQTVYSFPADNRCETVKLRLFVFGSVPFGVGRRYIAVDLDSYELGFLKSIGM